MASDSIPSYYPYGRNVAAAEMNGDSMLHGARDFFMESRYVATFSGSAA